MNPIRKLAVVVVILLAPMAAQALFIDKGGWGLDLPPPLVTEGHDWDPNRSFFWLSDEASIDYNATTQILLIEQRARGDEFNSIGEPYPTDDVLTTLVSIDNDGNLNSGFMAWTGRVPELGIENESLLFFGIFEDFGYTLRGLSDLPDAGDNFTGVMRVEHSIYDFGPYAGYSTFFLPFAGDLAGIPEGRCYPIMTAECLFDEDFQSEGFASNYEFFGLRARVSVAEPGTVTLFAIGLAGLGLARRRKSGSQP